MTHGRAGTSRFAALAIAAAATFFLAAPAQAAPGDLDPSFSGDGVQTTTFGSTPRGGPDEANDAVAAPGGGYYVAGTSAGAILVARYTAAGALDTTFAGGAGVASIDAPNPDRGLAIALDSSNRPVVSGVSGDDFALARFTTAGAPDPAFGGGDGLVTTDFAGGDDQGNSVAALSDGRIVVAGVTEGDDDEDFAVAAYTATGDLDSGFGVGGVDGDGRVTLDLNNAGDDGANDVVVSGGTLYAAGYSDAFSGSDDFAIVALSTATGALDGSFDGDGIKIIDFNGSFDSAYAITIDSSGRLVLAGSVSVPSENSDVGIARLNTTGVLDGTFSGDGKVTLSFPATLSSDNAQAVTTDAAGNVFFAGGTGTQGPDPGVILAGKVTNAGAPDTGFSGDGLAVIDVTPGNSGYDTGEALILDTPSNSLIVFGTAGQASGNSNIAVAKLVASTGDPDPSFGGGDGIVTTDIRRPANSSETARDVALQPDGKFVVTGPTNVAPLDPDRGDFDFGVARYNADGSLDTGFAPGGLDGDGKATVNFGGGSGGTPGTSDDPNAVAVQPDGKIVAAGFSGSDIALARFTSAGVPDPAFGGGDGLVTTNLGGVLGESAESILVQGTPGDPDFRIVVGGWKVETSSQDGRFALVAYDEAGDPDGDFGTGGVVTTKIGPAGTSDRAFDIAEQPDGRIVAVGESFSFAANQQQFAVARYAADGGLDSSFSPGGAEGDGRALTDFNGAFDSASAVVVRDLGAGALRIYVGGAANVNGFQGAIAAYDASGALDSAFSPGGTEGDGRAVYGSSTQRIQDLELGPDDTVYAAGDFGGDDAFGVMRVGALGAPDATFGGGDGIATIPDPDNAGSSIAQGLVIQPDGKPVAAGGNQIPQQGYDFLLARFRVDADPVPPGNPPVVTSPPLTGTPPGTVAPAKPAKPKCKKPKGKKKGGKKPKKCGKKKRPKK